MKIELKETFLNSFFMGLYSSIGFSQFYKKYVIVEPMGIITKVGDALVDYIDVTNLLYGIEHLGNTVAGTIDTEAGGHIEQCFGNFDDFIFICDNPILFPFNRLGDLCKLLCGKPIGFPHNRTKGPNWLYSDRGVLIEKMAGIIHYHIDEPSLNDDDIEALDWFGDQMLPFGKNEIVGLIGSQSDPSELLRTVELSVDRFLDQLFLEYRNGEFTFDGKLFVTNTTQDVHIIH